jgi:hypothetical protein
MGVIRTAIQGVESKPYGRVDERSVLSSIQDNIWREAVRLMWKDLEEDYYYKFTDASEANAEWFRSGLMALTEERRHYYARKAMRKLEKTQ